MKSFNHVLIICYSPPNFQSHVMKLQWLKLETEVPPKAACHVPR